MYRVLILLKCQNVDIGPFHPAWHPRMYVRPILGEDQGLIRVLEGSWTGLPKEYLPYGLSTSHPSCRS